MQRFGLCTTINIESISIQRIRLIKQDVFSSSLDKTRSCEVKVGCLNKGARSVERSLLSWSDSQSRNSVSLVAPLRCLVLHVERSEQ